MTMRPSSCFGGTLRLPKPAAKFAVIIPLAPGELCWGNLVCDLKDLPRGSEVILVGPSAPAGEAPFLPINHLRVSWVRSPLGRAKQLNAGAKSASATILWFLHADTRLPRRWLAGLLAAVARQPNALHYFDLKFADDGPKWMALNAAGVWLRSHVFGMPFGDQGFCISTAAFWALGGFDGKAPYGEDHLLVWAARRHGLPLRPVGDVIVTSARKYADRGWLPTTARHLTLTWQQAWPELKRIYRPSFGKSWFGGTNNYDS